MTKQEFKKFVQNQCIANGFKTIKSCYYLAGKDSLCKIWLQKSNYGNIYYVNYDYYDGFNDYNTIPSNEARINGGGRIVVMSRTQKYKGEFFLTGLIEYEEYTESELYPYFEREFKTNILPRLLQ